MKENIKVLFFDTTLNQLLRFGNKISEVLKENYSNVTTIGVVCEKKSKNPPIQSFDLLFESKSNKKVGNFVSSCNPDIAVLVQNTVADQNVILRAKKAGAVVFVLQHGMLYEGASLNNFNFREVFTAILNFKKLLKYLITMKQMCSFDKKSYFSLIRKIIKQKNNVARILQNHFSVKLNGDYAMVIGEKWIDYYCENYDYSKDKVFLMGNHDVDNLRLDVQLENAVCYIPSVHVEDGKVRISKFNAFLKTLADAIEKDKKLYIKMHPRGNINIYKNFFKNHNVVYVTGPELPCVTTYIGHNSTLLAKALMLTNKVILWGFKEEKELFYKPWAYAFCEKPDELKTAIRNAINDNKNDEAVIQEIRKISYINPEGAFQYAARTIMELYYASNGGK